jgi:hypothetical protein
MNTYSINPDNSGKTVVRHWESIQRNNRLPSDWIQDEFKDSQFDNLKIVFDDTAKTFDHIAEFVCPINRAHKTLGTYITRINKIANGIDPDNTQTSYNSASSPKSNAAANVAIQQPDPDESDVKLYRLDDPDVNAIVNPDGLVNTKHYNDPDIRRYIEALNDPRRWMNRVDELIQFTPDGKRCESPHWIIKFKGFEYEYNQTDEPDADAVTRGQLSIAQRLVIKQIKFDTDKLYATEPVQVGGGEVWLKNYIDKHYPKPNRPLPKSKDGEEVEAESA